MHHLTEYAIFHGMKLIQTPNFTGVKLFSESNGPLVCIASTPQRFSTDTQLSYCLSSDSRLDPNSSLEGIDDYLQFCLRF